MVRRRCSLKPRRIKCPDYGKSGKRVRPSIAIFPVGNSKLIVAWVVWGLYLIIGLIMARQALSPRQVAWFASVGFAVPLISLWLVTTHA
ncbi:MAG TPA: hypothetical protein VD994_02215 [Prosthecobacter sp.]|nr:hypothetical protein [Prosthecobacter sp.]